MFHVQLLFSQAKELRRGGEDQATGRHSRGARNAKNRTKQKTADQETGSTCLCRLRWACPKCQTRASTNLHRLIFVSCAQAQFRQDQQKELTALLKRIDGRRKEHIKQRNTDSQRSNPNSHPSEYTHVLSGARSVCCVPECEMWFWSWIGVL